MRQRMAPHSLHNTFKYMNCAKFHVWKWRNLAPPQIDVRTSTYSMPLYFPSHGRLSNSYWRMSFQLVIVWCLVDSALKLFWNKLLHSNLHQGIWPVTFEVEFSDGRHASWASMPAQRRHRYGWWQCCATPRRKRCSTSGELCEERRAADRTVNGRAGAACALAGAQVRRLPHLRRTPRRCRERAWWSPRPLILLPALPAGMPAPLSIFLPAPLQACLSAPLVARVPALFSSLQVALLPATQPAPLPVRPQPNRRNAFGHARHRGPLTTLRPSMQQGRAA